MCVGGGDLKETVNNVDGLNWHRRCVCVGGGGGGGGGGAVENVAGLKLAQKLCVCMCVCVWGGGGVQKETINNVAGLKLAKVWGGGRDG